MNHRCVALIMRFATEADILKKFFLFPTPLLPEGKGIEAVAMTDDDTRVGGIEGTQQAIFKPNLQMDNGALKLLFLVRDIDKFGVMDVFWQGDATLRPCRVAPQIFNQRGFSAAGPPVSAMIGRM